MTHLQRLSHLKTFRTFHQSVDSHFNETFYMVAVQ